MNALSTAGQCVAALVLVLIAGGFGALAFFRLLIWLGGVEDEPAEPAPTARSDIRP